MAEVASWKARLDRHALGISLGVIVLAVALVAVGVQVAPETFYDKFVWEDIYGPLAVDAHQCRNSQDALCRDLGPASVPAKDGYTVTSELVYGATLAVLLYGIYVGLFRRHGIIADGHFVLALLPWILLGPLARALEDANVFCAPGTDCVPSPFAYVFISPVIYIHIALYVIAFMLLGVFLERRRDAAPHLLTGAVASLLAAGVAAFGLVKAQMGGGFSDLPPMWFVALTALLAAGVFHWRAKDGKASMNLTVFVLGLPYALGCIYLITDWVTGNIWSRAAWNGEIHWDAGLFILFAAAAIALLVRFAARRLADSPAERGLAEFGTRFSEKGERNLLYAGLAGVFLALVLAGSVPRLSALVPDFGQRATLVPLAAALGALLLLAFALVHVGRTAAVRPGVLLVFAAGLNVALVFAHMVDGIATWVALEDPLNFGLPQYAEKHPFSDFLLKFWNGFLFPFAKLVMVFVIVWLLDKEFQENTPDERNLVGLIKMAIFVLGFAPGLRDVLRVLMGV